MTAKAESTFIRSVHKHLPPTLHHEKMANPFRGGTADCWYSGDRDLWVEYKFISKVPVKADIKADLSLLQLKWLHDRFKEGRNVAVIIGSPKGGLPLTRLQWERAISPADYTAKVLGRAQLAAWIVLATMDLS